MSHLLEKMEMSRRQAVALTGAAATSAFSSTVAATPLGQGQSRADWINVRDFGAAGDWNGKAGTDDSAAFKRAFAQAQLARGVVYIPKGRYLVQKTLHINGGISVVGDGVASTELCRTRATVEVIDGIGVDAVLYVTGGWNHIRDLTITGHVGTTTTSTTAVLFGHHIAAKGSVKNIAANYFRNAVSESAGIFLTKFENVQAVSCQCGFNFSSAIEKTSLIFEACYAANCGQAFDMRLVNYSTMTSCAADNCNWGSLESNPYGIGFGIPESAKGIYNFDQCSMTLNSIGAEGSYGNGVICSSSSLLSINSSFSYGCMSSFRPDSVRFPGYAVGPIQCTTAANSLVIATPFHRGWTNRAISPRDVSRLVAELVAFNYDENSLGKSSALQVLVMGGLSPAGSLIKGMGPIRKNCVVMAT